MGAKTPASLGVLLPQKTGGNRKHTASLFPTEFLLKANGTSLVANTFSTLETLGILIPLIIEPHRCVGRDIWFQIHNVAMEGAIKTRRCNDRLAHIMIRVAYLVAGTMECKLFVTWIPRRLNVGSVIADDLTH